MKRLTITYNPTLNNNQGGYPTPPSNTAINYFGWVNPAIFYTMKPQDKWTFGVPNPDNVIEITTADEGNIQSIIDNAPNYTRILFKATNGLPTIYKTGNLKPNSEKVLQLVGEKDAQGRKLITIDNSIVLTGFVLDSGLYKKTGVTAPTNIEITPDYTPNSNGFYSQLPFLLLVNGVPFDPVASTTEVTAEPNDKFYYDNATEDLWIGFDPTGKEIRWATNDNFFSSGGVGANSVANNPADNIVIKHFIIKYLGGTNQFGSSVGGRQGNWNLAQNYRPIQRWLIEDIEISYCRAGGIRGKLGGAIINCTTSNCGGGLITGSVIGQNSWDIGYRPNENEYCIIRGNHKEFNGWIKADGGVNQKLNRSYQTLHINNTSYKDGSTNVRNLKSTVAGEWFDNCYYMTMRGCRFIESGESGIFMEISYYGDIQYCDFIRCDKLSDGVGNSAGGIYNSSSKYMVYENNYFEIIGNPDNNIKARPIYIYNDDRGSGYLGVWETTDVSFSNNRIKYLENRGKIQLSAIGAGDTLVPNYKNWTGKNIIIKNNTYEGFNLLSSRYHIQSVGGITLATLQAYTDNNNVPYNWEENITIIN